MRNLIPTFILLQSRAAEACAATLRRVVVIAVAILIAGLPGCRTFDSARNDDVLTLEPVRISELTQDGGPQRRASMRLLLDGLDDDRRGDARRALARYERALQVDPNNPYAYLAIARLAIDGGEAERALAYLDKAGALLSRQGGIPPRVDVQLTGLRGSVLYMMPGRQNESIQYLDRARTLAPEVWGDGVLSPDELR